MSTKNFPTIYLWCISLVFFVACTVSQPASDQYFSKIILMENGQLTKFKTTITFSQAQLTGMLIAKTANDTIRAAFINEFGLKGFEFQLVGKKGKVAHVMPAMDKWYIRRTLSSDLTTIFSATDHQRLNLINEGDSVFTLKNEKRNITYRLQKIK